MDTLIFCCILLCYILLQTIDYFDLVKCEVKGQEFKKSGNSCPPTCEAPNPIPCTKDCVSGCQCRNGLVFDEENNRCVNKKDCDM